MCSLSNQSLESFDQAWGERLASELVHQLAVVDACADAVDNLALNVPRGDQLLLTSIQCMTELYVILAKLLVTACCCSLIVARV